MTQEQSPVPTQTIIIDGKEYAIDAFSQQVRGMVNLRDVWVREQNEERAALTKTEAAIRQLDNELLEVINAELKVKTQLDEESQKNAKAVKPVAKKAAAKKPARFKRGAFQ
jgi:hypothetical protein